MSRPDVVALQASLKRRIYAMAYSMGVDGEELFHASAEIIIKKAGSFDQGHISGACLETYLLSQIKGCALEMRAQQKGRVDADVDGDMTPEVAFAMQAQADESAGTMHRYRTCDEGEALERIRVLPPLLAQVAALVFDGKDKDEVAQALRITKRQVYNLLAEATNLLTARPNAAQMGLFGGEGEAA